VTGRIFTVVARILCVVGRIFTVVARILRVVGRIFTVAARILRVVGRIFTVAGRIFGFAGRSAASPARWIDVQERPADVKIRPASVKIRAGTFKIRSAGVGERVLMVATRRHPRRKRPSTFAAEAAPVHDDLDGGPIVATIAAGDGLRELHEAAPGAGRGSHSHAGARGVTDLDLAIVGAGTAGAALALHAARAGLRVVCVDRRPLDAAGARWVNGVPRWMFAEAGLDEPVGAERVGGGHPFHLVAGYGPTRVVVREHDVLDVDMRLLVARLQAGAREAGAELRGDVTVHGLSDGALATSAGELRARWFVDASGLSGARLLGQATPPSSDLCSAAQEVRVVRDPAGARAFLAQHDVQAGSTLCFTSVAGGYSIVNVRIEEDASRVGLLTGSITAGGNPGGARLLASFVAAQPWIGQTLFGGARAIPLGLPRELGRGPVALLGDAACQVFAAHGSGIGVGLVAARLLAGALASGAGPRGYARAFHRRFGLLLRTYDAVRRLSQRLSTRQVALLMRTGVLSARIARLALEQRSPLARSSRIRG
jgi:flavin-dependent dehydrogenase